MKKFYLILCSLISLTMVGCQNKNNSQSDNISSDNKHEDVSVSISKEETPSEVSSIDDNSDEDISSIDDIQSNSEYNVSETSSEGTQEIDENFDFSSIGFGNVTTEKMEELPDYNPTTFDKSKFKDETESLGEGVTLHKISFEKSGKTNGTSYTLTLKPYVVEVDMNKASVVAGSYDNTTSTADYTKKSSSYQQATAWERDNPGRKVLAATNADYFAWGDTGNCVNAFVKNGVILKESHVYDLNDVPVSKPMLFGVSSLGARIAPISTNANYQDNLAANLRYLDKLVVIDGKTNEAKEFDYNLDRGVINSGIGVLKTPKDTQYGVRANAKVYKYTVIQKDKSNDGEVRGYISEVLDVSDVKTFVDVKNDNYGYIVVHPNEKDVNLKYGDYIDINRIVTSTGGEWYGYTQILGARHSLVENGQIAPTVSKETSNGTNGPRARTAVGIKPNGNVIIVSFEEVSPDGIVDTRYGVNITYLADFMRYLGCYDACNFDGGGSCQLITRTNNGNGDFVVRTRSSDFATYNLNDTRKVLNTIMVVTK